MKQHLTQKKVVHGKHPKQNHHEKYTWNKSYINVECPYCNSNDGFILWSQYDTIGHCPDCSKNWLESGGTIWKV